LRGINGWRLLLEPHDDRCAYAMDGNTGVMEQRPARGEGEDIEVECALRFRFSALIAITGEGFSTGIWPTIFLNAQAGGLYPLAAYHKNDNARVEQKNWTMSDNWWVRALAIPCRPCGSTSFMQRNGASSGTFSAGDEAPENGGGRKPQEAYLRQTHHAFERLKACAGVDPKEIWRLQILMATLDPFELKRIIEKKLRRVLLPQRGRINRRRMTPQRAQPNRASSKAALFSRPTAPSRGRLLKRKPSHAPVSSVMSQRIAIFFALRCHFD